MRQLTATIEAVKSAALVKTSSDVTAPSHRPGGEGRAGKHGPHPESLTEKAVSDFSRP